MTLILPSMLDSYLILSALFRNRNEKFSFKLLILSLLISSPIDYISKRFSQLLFIEIVVFIVIILLYLFIRKNTANLWTAIIISLEIAIYNMIIMAISTLKTGFNLDEIYIIIITITIFVLSRWFMFYKLFYTNKYEMNLVAVDNKGIIFKSIGFLGLIAIICFLAINGLYEINESKLININILIIFAFLILIFFYLYISIQKFMKYIVTIYEKKILEDQYRLTEYYLNIVESKTNELKMLSHNIKDHLLMIKYLAEKDNEELIKYLDDVKKIEDIGNIIRIEQMEYISPIIQNKIEIALQYGVKIKIFNKLEDEIYDNWDRIDIVLIVSNLLDNAINALKTCDSKFRTIEFTVGENNNYLYFKSSNYFSSSNRDFKNINSIRNDRLERGNGLKIIDTIVKKYSGWLEYNIEDDIITFIATLIK